jgi:hypothetical protein
MKALSNLLVSTWILATCLAVVSCREKQEEQSDTVGLLGTGLFFPYPSIHLMAEDADSSTGWRVDIPADILPVAENGTPMPVEKFNRLDGFSPATPMLVFFENVTVDPAALPGVAAIGESTAPDSPVQIIDLETGERLPLLAETDAHPNAVSLGRQTLIIRPQKIMRWAAHYAVVLTTAVRDTAGRTVPVPENFGSLVSGKKIPPSLRPWEEHYAALFGRLGEIGIDMADVVLAWDFWTGSREVTHAQIDYIMEKTREALPADPDFMPQYEIIESRYLDSDLDPDINPLIWRHMELTFKMKTFVNAEGVFELDDSGMPREQGEDDFALLVHIPPSVHDAAAGTVPVIVFGHGMLGSPNDYLVREGDQLHALEASNRYGAIYAAPEFRGMSARDQLDAVTAATDFGKFHYITEDLHMETRFRDDPFFLASDGSGSLVDTDRIYYFGISLGGHEGGVVTALSDVFRYAVLQVGGGPWTLMLERSSNWSKYDIIITTWVRDPVDRQMLYAVSQMLWDPVDPATHWESLARKSVLLQESVGDAQVPNIATEFWARSMGFPLVLPTDRHPAFMDEIDAPTDPGGSALFMYNALYHEDCGAAPPEENLPAEDNCAHQIVSRCEAQYEQIEAFFGAGREGTIIQPPDCGSDPCRPQR